MSDASRLAGVLAPVLTPFKSDLSPDHGRFVRLCRSLLSQGAGLAVFGTTSEANSLSVQEKIDLLNSLADAGVDPARILVGTGSCALPDSLCLTGHAMKLGCAGVLMLPPFYYKEVPEEGLFQSFAKVIERVGEPRLRVYLYHIPPISNVPITVGLVERLLEAYPTQIAGMKDSSGDWANTQAFLSAFAPSGFDVFVGSETFLLANMRAGGAGCISATANVNPGPIANLWRSWQAGDAEDQQNRVNHVREVFAKFPLIPALKAAMAHYQKDADWAAVRPPLVQLTRERADALVAELTRSAFTMV